MAINLEADNRTLGESGKYSYLIANYISATTSLTVLNATDSEFAAGAYLLLGSFGSETAEIVQINTVNNTTGALTLISATKFPHAESTKVTVIPYNQVRFFWTPTEVFSTVTPLTVYVDIQPSDWFTTFNDGLHPTGYGWYIWFNSTTLVASQESNSLPYTGFARDTVEDIISDFFSLLNNKELKLVSRDDALSWLDEANSKVRNRLNLSNREFSSSVLETLTTQPGVSEYDLPRDFYQLISLTGTLDNANILTAGNYSKFPIGYLPLTQAFTYIGSEVKYYIRGHKIGLLPLPSAVTTYYYMYLKKTTSVRDGSEAVDIPDNGFFCLKDWMMYRASLKFQNQSMAAMYLKSFQDSLNDMIISAIDRNAALDDMGITPEAMS